MDEKHYSYTADLNSNINYGKLKETALQATISYGQMAIKFLGFVLAGAIVALPPIVQFLDASQETALITGLLYVFGIVALCVCLAFSFGHFYLTQVAYGHAQEMNKKTLLLSITKKIVIQINMNISN